MSEPLRLLISARDPGAASHMISIAHAALAEGDIHLTLCAGTPALVQMRGAGLTPIAADTSGDACLALAHELIARYRPDVILVGLSGPEAGIDEALLAAAGTIPTLAYQDFWGDLNAGFGCLADHYLVRDALAAELTEARAQVATTIVGSPFHAQLDARQLQRARRRLRRQLRAAPHDLLVGLCGQPLWRYPGYRLTLRRFVRTLRRKRPHARLLVRPHPRDSHSDRLRLRRLCGHRARLLSKGAGNDFLAACDLIVSAFSNCNLDKVEIDARLGGRRPRPLYLMYQPELRRLYRHWTGLACLPLTTQHQTNTVDRVGRLPVIQIQPVPPTTGRIPSIPAARTVLALVRAAAQACHRATHSQDPLNHP